MSASILGAWRLADFVGTRPGAAPIHPMGEGAKGQLIYSASGRMSALLSRAGRAPLPVDRLEAYARAPEAEKAAAFDGFVSYGGTFTFTGAEVAHHVEIASVPNLVGQTQTRAAALAGDTLTLAYDAGRWRYTLCWIRVGRPDV